MLKEEKEINWGMWKWEREGFSQRKCGSED